MNKVTPQNIDLFNESLRHESPEEIISFVLEITKRPLVTTSFGAYSAAILHACTQVNPEMQVVWCDTGYNTEATYKHVFDLSSRLCLNLETFTPKYTTAFLDSKFGRPNINNPNHKIFSEEVKLEPFKRAFAKYCPDVWFSNIRKGQTKLRDSLDILSFSNAGVLKVSPFYYFDDIQMLEYMRKHKLPVEFDYFDPVKALSNRECGIHFEN